MASWQGKENGRGAFGDVGATLGTLGHGELPALARRYAYRKNNRAQHVTYWAMENLTKEIFDE